MARKKRRSKPEDLERLPQDERIEKLEEKIRALGGKSLFSSGHDLPPDVHEQFLKNVLATEEAGWSEPADLLEDGGVELTPADELDDEDLPKKLRDLIHAMALHNMFLVHTDHLTDRELYTELVEEHLRGQSMLGPAEPKRGYNFIIDIVGSGSDEDNQLYLRYHADDKTRALHQRDWPDEDLPPKEKPVADRDRFLPQPDWTPVDWDEDEPFM